MSSQATEYYKEMQEGKAEHKSLAVDVDIVAPIIYIPENIYLPNTPYLKLACGQIEIKSQLVDFNNEKDFYKDLLDEALLYDQYIIDFQRISLKLVEPGLSVRDQ